MEKEKKKEEMEEDTQKDKFMTFQTGREYFGISISYVNEIIVMPPITPVPDVEHYIKGLLNLRGKIIPVIDVRARFGMEEIEYNDRTCIIVIDVKSTVIGLIVERIAEVCNIKENDITPPPTLKHKGCGQNKYVYGLARVGNSVKLLLDPEKLIRDEESEETEEQSEEEEE